MSVDPKLLKSAIMALNKAKITTKIAIGKKSEDLLVADFIKAIGDVEDNSKIPKAATDFYTNLPDEYFDEEEEGETGQEETDETDQETDQEDAEEETDEEEDDDLFGDDDDLFNDDDDDVTPETDEEGEDPLDDLDEEEEEDPVAVEKEKKRQAALKRKKDAAAKKKAAADKKDAAKEKKELTPAQKKKAAALKRKEEREAKALAEKAAENEKQDDSEEEENEELNSSLDECSLCGDFFDPETMDEAGNCPDCAEKEAEKAAEAKKQAARDRKKAADKKKVAGKGKTKGKSTKKNSNSMSTVVQGKDFFQLLNRAFLAKTIEECMIMISGGYAMIIALDTTESVFVKSIMECPGEFGPMGIGNLEVLHKYFKSRSKVEVTIERKDNRLILNSSGHENFAYLLSEEDMITTYTDQLVPLADIDTVVADYAYTCDLDETQTKSVLEFLKILKSEICTVVVEPSGTVCISGGDDGDHRFSVDIDEVTVDEEIEYPMIPVHSKYLKQILTALDFEDEVTLHISPDETVVIQNGESAWGLSEVVEDE